MTASPTDLLREATSRLDRIAAEAESGALDEAIAILVGAAWLATRSLASLSTPMRHMPPKAMMAVINRMTPKPRPRRGPTRRLLKFMVVSDIGYWVTMEQTGVGGWSMCLLPGTSLALGLGV